MITAVLVVLWLHALVRESPSSFRICVSATQLSGRPMVSFIESHFSSKVEYEAWVANAVNAAAPVPASAFRDMGLDEDGYDYGQHLREINPDGVYIPRAPHAVPARAEEEEMDPELLAALNGEETNAFEEDEEETFLHGLLDGARQEEGARQPSRDLTDDLEQKLQLRDAGRDDSSDEGEEWLLG